MVHLAITKISKIMKEEELRTHDAEDTTTEAGSSIWYS